jgi:hypothetical protein
VRRLEFIQNVQRFQALLVDKKHMQLSTTNTWSLLFPTTQKKKPGYCWRTPTYRNGYVQHTFFEGKKAEETSPRKKYS